MITYFDGPSLMTKPQIASKYPRIISKTPRLCCPRDAHVGLGLSIITV